jgi:aminoglycoside/choline kinase family phosphotransferase
VLDKRLIDLTHWVAQRLGEPGIEVTAASSDASFRRYFRVTSGGGSYIVMDAPPDKEDTAPYVQAAKRLFAIGLNVPEVLDSDDARGFLLLTDLGTRTYLEELTPQKVDRLYGDALGALIVLQTGTYTDPNGFPDYNDSLLMQEMELFRHWYIGRHLKQELTSSQHRTLDDMFSLLIGNARAQARVWVHRDYHSRNLMVTPTNNPGILDFQDAVIGPVTYDLVSLLRDCYICWRKERVEDWAKGYHDVARQSGLPVGDNEEQFIKDFDWMGVQRHLKVLGIFSRLSYRDGKTSFLDDLPQVYQYLIEVCGAYPDLEPLYSLLLQFPPSEP